MWTSNHSPATFTADQTVHNLAIGKPSIMAGELAWWLLCLMSIAPRGFAGESRALRSPLAETVARIEASFADIDATRRNDLDHIATAVVEQIRLRRATQVMFVCTHNSRRSQFAQVWAHLAIAHYGVDGVQAVSGGTEVTACNSRTIEALRRAGLRAEIIKPGDNPHYRLKFDSGPRSLDVYSKLYDSIAADNFVAVMCCADADEQCPVVEGAAERFSLHYIDPKVSDETPTERHTYDERSLTIAREMFYLFSRIEAERLESLGDN